MAIDLYVQLINCGLVDQCAWTKIKKSRNESKIITMLRCSFGNAVSALLAHIKTCNCVFRILLGISQTMGTNQMKDFYNHNIIIHYYLNFPVSAISIREPQQCTRDGHLECSFYRENRYYTLQRLSIKLCSDIYCKFNFAYKPIKSCQTHSTQIHYLLRISFPVEKRNPITFWCGDLCIGNFHMNSGFFTEDLETFRIDDGLYVSRCRR